jgi:hypothetical protein
MATTVLGEGSEWGAHGVIQFPVSRRKQSRKHFYAELGDVLTISCLSQFLVILGHLILSSVKKCWETFLEPTLLYGNAARA